MLCSIAELSVAEIISDVNFLQNVHFLSFAEWCQNLYQSCNPTYVACRASLGKIMLQFCALVCNLMWNFVCLECDVRSPHDHTVWWRPICCTFETKNLCSDLKEIKCSCLQKCVVCHFKPARPQIRLFLKGLGDIFFFKIAQIFGNFLGYFEKHPFLRRNSLGYLATFDSNIRAHCFQRQCNFRNRFCDIQKTSHLVRKWRQKAAVALSRNPVELKS